MAAPVRRVLTEPELAERLSRNARYKAYQYDWSVVLPRWKIVFREIGNWQPCLICQKSTIVFPIPCVH